MSFDQHFLGQDRSYGHALWLEQAHRYQHLWLLGQSGTGKSSWARQSFMQDVMAGRGACYFDFHGEDARWLLDRIPKHRIEDVVYFDPLEPNFALGYNPLDGVAAKHFASYTDEIVGALRHIFASSWGPRMDDILMNAIRPLFDLPPQSKGTLLGAVRLLNDPLYRKFAVDRCTEQTVRDFWFSEFAAWSKNDRAHNVNSSLNKIRRFQSAPVLRNILGQQTSGLNIRTAIARQRLVILNFNKWRIGAKNADILASLILSRIIYEATHRDVPTVKGQDVETLAPGFHIVIDEFQSVSSLAMVEALAGIRKNRVSFALSHQHTDQIEPEVLAAMRGNIGTKIVFRVGGDDAKRLQQTVEVTNAKELATQPDYEFTLQYKAGSNVATRRARSLLAPYVVQGNAAKIINWTNHNHARPINQVAEQYDRWQASRHYGGVSAPGAKVQQVKKKRVGEETAIGAIMMERFGRGSSPETSKELRDRINRPKS